MMNKINWLAIFYTLVIFILISWKFDFSFDYATSIIPGWHTTIVIPKYLIVLAGIALFALIRKLLLFFSTKR